MPYPRRDSSTGSWESDMNQWLLRGETPDKKAFEFLNVIRDHTPFVLDENQIRKFDVPDVLILRGQVILKGDAVSYEPFHQKPSSNTLPTILTMFLEGFEGNSLPTFTCPSFEAFRFCVKNKGQQTVRDFRSTLYIPQAFRFPSMPLRNLSKKGESTINDTQYVIYENLTQSPIYGNEQIRIGELILQGDPANHTILWKIRCDDGIFPKEDEYGEIKVCLVPLGNLVDEAVRNAYKK
ncbi:MAG: hypothetical protein P0120_00930 [Nitrospira sp.]|nr:hypothetical protein [Nitrospira sp.]